MYLLKSQTNKVALTLTEKADNANSEWLIKLTNDTTGQEKVFAVEDISEYPLRSNIFEITESISEDLYNGRVYLTPVGQWSYIAYEMAPSSPRNLDPADAIKIVETGVCTVEGEETENSFFDEDDDKNNAVFDA